MDLPRGVIKRSAEDFVVEEIPAYAPAGLGDHVFLRITKRDKNTLDTARLIADSLGCDHREVGYAGMKDRRAIATQTISVHAPTGADPHSIAARARQLSLDGIVVHDATPHTHKLKPGHLAGNRFAIVVRDIAPGRMAEVTRALDHVALHGIPNEFGAQRFGRSGDNVARAIAWLRGRDRPPRDPRIRRLLWSSVQSAIFNELLQSRIRDGSWATPQEGDLLKLRSSGGMFVCSAVQEDRARAERGELSPTGPIVGARMRWPEGKPGELERHVTAEILGDGFDLGSTRRLGEGSRRALRLWVQDLRFEVAPNEPGGEPGKGGSSVRVYFVLPKGGYATTVLGAALIVDETGEPPTASSIPPDDQSDDPDSERRFANNGAK